MDPVSGAVLYIIIWWVILFTVLPIGVRTAEETGGKTEPGMATSAPVKPHMGRKFAATTLIAALLWLVIYLIVVNEWISLDGLFDLRPASATYG